MTDRLHIAQGYAKIVLYDARSSSPTKGKINEFCLGSDRQGLVVVPNGVWHAMQNMSHEPCLVINLVDKAYSYDDPDHWRLPLDTGQIPYAFGKQDSTDAIDEILQHLPLSGNTPFVLPCPWKISFNC